MRLATFSHTMQQIKININFSQFDPFTKLVYDHSLATDSNKSIDLIRFVKTYYNQNWSKMTVIQIYDAHELYQYMIVLAIRSGNLYGLEVLWQGIYWHDHSNPDYFSDVYTAVQFSDLKMLQHVLYGYMNYHTLEEVEELDYPRLKELVAKNPHPEVSKFIESLACCVTKNNKIISLCENCFEDEYLRPIYSLGKRFYECVQSLVM